MKLSDLINLINDCHALYYYRTGKSPQVAVTVSNADYLRMIAELPINKGHPADDPADFRILGTAGYIDNKMSPGEFKIEVRR
jgi:hypothetical protein